MKFFSFILIIGLVLGMASYSIACGICTYDYRTYNYLSFTHWIPGDDVGIAEAAIQARKVLKP